MSERLPWDVWFVLMADFVAQRSKDPSTQCGAVIVRPDNTIAATGYNGFPRGIEDKPELLSNRDEKYPRMIHAEVNAILTAREPLHGYTLYVSPMPCCERCAVLVAQAGIKKVVYPVPSKERLERWGDSFKLSHAIFDEAGVTRVMIDAGMKAHVQ